MNWTSQVDCTKSCGEDVMLVAHLLNAKLFAI